MEFHAGSDGIAVAAGAVAMEFESDEWLCRGVVQGKAHARCGAVGGPDIEVSVKVPIAGGQAASVVGIIETSQGGNGGEGGSVPAAIQVGAVPLISAEGTVFVEQSIERAPALLIPQTRFFGEIVDW